MAPRQIKPVACYIRISTLDQEKGLKSQKAAIMHYLEGHGLAGQAEFYIDRRTGGDFERSGWKKLQENVFSGHVKTVVVWKLDRLARNLREGFNVLMELIDRKVRVVSITQQLELEKSMGKFLAALLLGLAEMEKETLRENTVRGLKEAAANGRFPGRPPKDEVGPSKMTAKQIKAMRTKGLSLAAIAKEVGVSRQRVHAILSPAKKSTKNSDKVCES